MKFMVYHWNPTRRSASSRETTRQVVCSLQLSDQISKFWLLQSLVSSLRTETLSRAQRGKFFIYYCFSFVLNCFLNKHGRAQRRNNFSTFLPMFFCISMYFLMKVAARSAEKFKTLQFVVSSLQQKSQVLEILNFVVYNRTCSLRDLSNSDFCSLQTTSRRPCKSQEL